MSHDDFKKYYMYLTNNYHTFLGLLISSIVIFTSAQVVLKAVLDTTTGLNTAPEVKQLIEYISLFTPYVLTFCNLLFWNYKRNTYPKVTNNRVGIILAIGTEDKKSTALHKDLITEIEELVNNEGYGEKIQVLTMSQHHSRRLARSLTEYNKHLQVFKKRGKWNTLSHEKKWSQIKKDVRGHFYIWGDIKRRTEGSKKYFINIHGLVAHTPVTQSPHAKLSKDIASGWFNTISFPETHEFSGFQISAKLVYVASRYITGLAAFISGDPNFAIEMHTGLQRKIQELKTAVDTETFARLLVVSNKLNRLLGEENYILALHHLYLGRAETAEKHVMESLSLAGSDPSYYLTLSSIMFEKGDIQRALKYAYKAKKYSGQDLTWRYNIAYLLMHKGEYNRALKDYIEITKKTYDGEDTALRQVFSFLEKRIQTKEKPVAIDLFIYGFLKYHKDSNLPESYTKLKDFLLKARKQNSLQRLYKHANKLYKKITKEIDQKSNPHS